MSDRIRAEHLVGLVDQPVPLDTKGWRIDPGDEPVSADGLRADPVGLWSGRFTFPLAVVDGSALDHNLTEMARYCERRGVRIAPHGKTTMSPEIAAAQLSAGAYAVTVASVHQAIAYHRYGVSRVLVANEVTDRASIDWLLATMDDDDSFEPIVCVDSVEAADLVAERAGALGTRRSLGVLIELGHPGGRTGARSIDAAIEVGKVVGAARGLHGVGVTGYEGTLGHDGTSEESQRVRAFCLDLIALGDRLVALGVLADRYVVSAAGSLFFTEVCDALADVAAADRIEVVLRSGAYVIHDDGYYEQVTPASRGVAGAPKFEPTTSVWAPVLSIPEPGLAIVLLGRRDIGFDQGLPRPLGHRTAAGELRVLGDAVTTDLNDQHAFVSLPSDAQVAVGDHLRFGISHPCTTYDKWRVLPIIEGDRAIDLIHTIF